MAKRGRPMKAIDKETFEKLCAMQCTETEISSFFGVCEDTLNAWCKRTYKMNFLDIFSQKRTAGHVSLRRTQFQMAEKSPAMAIWLGKQYLGQREVIEQNITTTASISKLDDILEAITTDKETGENNVEF